MGGSSKSAAPPPPPPAPPAAPERADVYQSTRRAETDAEMRRRGRAANVLSGSTTQTGGTQTGTKTLLGQ